MDTVLITRSNVSVYTETFVFVSLCLCVLVSLYHLFTILVPHHYIFIFIIFHSTFPNTQILKHDTKVTRSSTNGSFLTVNVSIIIRSFLEVTKMSQILSLDFNDR